MSDEDSVEIVGRDNQTYRLYEGWQCGECNRIHGPDCAGCQCIYGAEADCSCAENPPDLRPTQTF